MDAELAALPPSAKIWAELLLESVHWCAAELPGRGTWPQRVVWAIVVLSIIDSWFHALFCMRYILYDLWLCYPLRDIKLYLQQRTKAALSCILFFDFFSKQSGNANCLSKQKICHHKEYKFAFFPHPLQSTKSKIQLSVFLRTWVM